MITGMPHACLALGETRYAVLICKLATNLYQNIVTIVVL
jgi:hypothetical protein